ncbi:MAG: iron chelate uptake ABC transporter family permease subunit [Leptolyngbyaceae cyanobacterium SM1_1_3]|nr:iron chelate uptake ABC transporter family permease subunit [Leptolyngbyaceae cyanobacterium SM1_1_3]NJO11987.1 iron chelate uptake ABC transporter family permease subunit [Leptolyngbyaceae cyanobacterium SL_1_1]
MVTLRKPPVQTVQPARSSYRTPVALGLLLLGLALVVSLSLTQGSVAMTRTELWAALLRQGTATHQVIVWDLRLPRLVAALLVGASLGVSGALLQGMLRNGLASPFLLGISSGAGLVVVLMVTLGLWQVWVPLGVWLGAILTTALVYLLACSRGGLSVERLILGGVAFSSFFGAIQSLLDEPTTFLDIHYQLQLLELLKRLNRERSLSIIINLATRYYDRMAMLRQGCLWAIGPPSQVLTAENLRQVFQVEVEIFTTPFGQQVFPVAASDMSSETGFFSDRPPSLAQP